MNLVDSFYTYFDIFGSKYNYLVDVHNSALVSEHDLINANNQFLTDLINAHAKSGLLSQYVSLNSDLFERKMSFLFGNIDLMREIIKVGSNISDYFGYCAFCSDSVDISEGFALVIDRNSLAFPHSDVQAMSDLISRNIRFSKVVYVSTNYDPSYQLPTYSLFGVNFNIVPAEGKKYPFVEF
ncbi:MAG: hypothetical protein MK214_07300 [Thalassotalea sp.]|nr:hypothetical protein [Thalassotalea sp.]